MITLVDLAKAIAHQGSSAASLISLANSPTSKSVVGVLAQRTGLQVKEIRLKDKFDLFLITDVIGRLKSPFAVVCVASEQVDNPQRLGVDVDHELRSVGIYDRPTLVLHSGSFASIHPNFFFSDQHFVFLSSAELVQILLSHPPRDALTKHLMDSTPLRLLNPYIYRGPIDDDRLFVGRDDDLKLLTRMSASYALVGPRSIGKTSLINKAIKTLKAQGRIVLRAEFSRALGELELLGKFIDQFVGEHEAWPGYVARVSASSFEKLVEHYGSEDERVIVFIDEADELAKRCPNLAASLHRLHNEGRLRFVLVGYKELRRSLSDAAGTLFNVAQKLELSSISSRECGALVVRPTVELGITFDDMEAVVSTLYEASGGAPSRIQLMCHALLNDLDHRKTRRITLADAKQAMHLGTVRDEIENWYRASTTRLERAIADCATILVGLPAPRTEIVKQISSKFPITADQVSWEIQDLITADVFRQKSDGTINFTFPELESMVRPTGDARTAMHEHLRLFRDLHGIGGDHEHSL